jgi:ABC-2 type transport system permease protein
MIKTAKYFAIFRLAIIHTLKNYKALIGLNLFLVACLLVFAHLWKAAATKIGVIDLNPEQLLWYIALNEWVLIAIPDIQIDIEQDLRSGKLAYLLPRPISYLTATFFQGLGTLCVNLLALGLIAFLFTWWRIGSFPFSIAGLAVIMILGISAGTLGVIFQMLIGISAFWLKEVSPFNWIWEKLLFALGGLILPLTIYPLWIQKIAYCTPFPAILSQRSALAIDFNLEQVLLVTNSLVFWGIVGVSSLILLYHRGLRILNIEGG